MSSESIVDLAVSKLESEECILTLAKVLDNILTETVYSKKTRKLKTTNATFQRRVLQHSGGIEFLFACRFTRKGDLLHLKQQHENKLILWNARRALHQLAKNKGYKTISKLPPSPHSVTGISAANANGGKASSSSPPPEVDEVSLYAASTIASTVASITELEAELLSELGSDFDTDTFQMLSPSQPKTLPPVPPPPSDAPKIHRTLPNKVTTPAVSPPSKTTTTTTTTTSSSSTTMTMTKPSPPPLTAAKSKSESKLLLLTRPSTPKKVLTATKSESKLKTRTLTNTNGNGTTTNKTVNNSSTTAKPNSSSSNKPTAVTSNNNNNNNNTIKNGVIKKTQVMAAPNKATATATATVKPIKSGGAIATKQTTTTTTNTRATKKVRSGTDNDDDNSDDDEVKTVKAQNLAATAKTKLNKGVGRATTTATAKNQTIAKKNGMSNKAPNLKSSKKVTPSPKQTTVGAKESTTTISSSGSNGQMSNLKIAPSAPVNGIKKDDVGKNGVSKVKSANGIHKNVAEKTINALIPTNKVTVKPSQATQQNVSTANANANANANNSIKPVTKPTLAPPSVMKGKKTQSPEKKKKKTTTTPPSSATTKKMDTTKPVKKTLNVVQIDNTASSIDNKHNVMADDCTISVDSLLEFPQDDLERDLAEALAEPMFEIPKPKPRSSGMNGYQGGQTGMTKTITKESKLPSQHISTEAMQSKILEEQVSTKISAEVLDNESAPESAITNDTKPDSQLKNESPETPGALSPPESTEDYNQPLSGTLPVISDGLSNGLEPPSIVEPPLDDLEREMQEALMEDMLLPQVSDIGAIQEGLETSNQLSSGLANESVEAKGWGHDYDNTNIAKPNAMEANNGIRAFFDEEEMNLATPADTDDEMPQRSRVGQMKHDDLENEMAKLLASSADHTTAMDLPAGVRWRTARTGVKELDQSLSRDLVNRNAKMASSPSSRSLSPLRSDGDNITIAPLSPTRSRSDMIGTSSAEEMAYSSLNAHSDWFKLNELMKSNSLQREYEICWGALCSLSVVCSDLPIEELGLKHATDGKATKAKGRRSKRSWLPLELVQGLWSLVLSSENTLDQARVSYVCSKLHDVLVGAKYLEVHDRSESEPHLPHATWVRVVKEKMVLLGFALPVSIEKQSDWMCKLAKAIADDINFWYGRFALPTIALAGGDDEAKAKFLLRDFDFVQSRLDVIGVITGTRRHIQDCKAYVKAKQEAYKEKKISNDEVRVGMAEEIGYDVALDGVQQVATCLYRSGQLLARVNGSASKKLELATALHLIGVAAGEWSDFDFEMQLYQKTVKILRDFGGYNTECAGDTLLSMGACNLGQGDFSAAMSCYEEAHDLYRNNLGPRHDKVSKALDHMGVIHCENGDLETAMEAFKISLKIRQDNGMRDDYDESMADTLCWIARVYREQNLPEKAKKYFDTAREVKEEIFGLDSLEVAEVLHNIAVLFDDEQDFERSLRYYRKSLKIRRAALGDEHEDVCELITCIGNVYKSMGDNTTALKAFRRALELRAAVAQSINMNMEQTKALIHSYEDVLDMLRREIRSSTDPDIEQDEIAAILLKMGHLYDIVENFDRSVRCFEKALKFRLTSGDQVKAGQVLNVMGISYAKRRKFGEAMTSFEQALALRKSAFGEIHSDIAETLHNMGNCAAKSGDLNEAREYYDESLRVKRKALGNSSTSVAQTLHNIGNVLAGQGSNEAALKHYEEALSMRRMALGNDHLEVAYSLHCIAKINRKQHNMDRARENFSSSLRIKRLKLGRIHPSIAETLEQLGSLYMEIGEEDEAALCLNGALNIYKSKNGEGIKVAEVYEVLGSKFERKGNTSKALIYYNKSLKARIKIFGDEDVSVATMHYKVGKLQRDQGSSHEALASLQAATKIRKKAIGRNDLMIADILCDAGKLQLKLGQAEVADKCFQEALRIRQHILDSRHEKIGECLLLKGDVLRENGDVTGAIEVFRESMDIFIMNGGEQTLLCADACERLGLAYRFMGDYEKAQELYEKCLSTRTKVHGAEHLEVAQVNHQLGSVYFDKEDFVRAEELFRDSVEVMVKILGEDHITVADAVLALGRTCTKLNSPDEATMYFEQARLTKQHHLGNKALEVEEIGLEIGRAHVVKGEYGDALECFNSYLKARRAAVGDDVFVSDILHDIGYAEYKLGIFDASLKSFASALALYRVLLGDENTQVAKTLFSLGLVYGDKSEYKESMKYYKESFRLYRRLSGSDDLEVANCLDKISTLYLKQPNLEKALQSMKEALRIRTHILGKGHLDVAASLFGMGVIFSECNVLDKAMECYSVALTIRSEKLGEASVEVAQTLHNMGTVFGKKQDVESALKHWQRALVAYREAGISDENHLVAVTIGNINMAESYLNEAGAAEDKERKSD